MTKISKKEFLTNRDETGREVHTFIETGKQYFVEMIEPRGFKSYWGDIDPATKKVTGTYGAKYTGGIKAEDSLITKENGFEEIVTGPGASVYETIVKMHDKWKRENGYG